MSDRRLDDLVADLLDLATEIEGYIAKWTEKEFLADRAKQRVIERTLELLGEVANRLGDNAPVLDEVDWRALADLRIVLAHAYHRVDQRRLWLHAKNDVPALKEAVAAWRDG